MLTLARKEQGQNKVHIFRATLHFYVKCQAAQIPLKVCAKHDDDGYQKLIGLILEMQT